jgi:hypothetical protein
LLLLAVAVLLVLVAVAVAQVDFAPLLLELLPVVTALLNLLLLFRPA